jgi:hypothetical protein
MRIDARIESLEVSVYRIPTSSPESDGTLEWNQTTLVVAEARGGGRVGLGYTYASEASGTAVRARIEECCSRERALP